MTAGSTGSNGLGAHLRAAVAADPVGWILVCKKWTEIVLYRVILVRRRKTKMNWVIAAAFFVLMVTRDIGGLVDSHSAGN